MPTSDSEDFESADEGHGSPDKKERKKRLSSSNYSDKALEADSKPTSVQKTDKKVEKPAKMAEKPAKKAAAADGWDDFDIDDDEPIAPIPPSVSTKLTAAERQQEAARQYAAAYQEALDRPAVFKKRDYKDSDWDEFGNWKEENNFVVIPEPTEPELSQDPLDLDLIEVADRLASGSTSGWSWGWNVDSLLNTATAGISNITSQVSQGISTVLETGIGAPDPEELARLNVREREGEPMAPRPEPPADLEPAQRVPPPEAYQFVSLFTNFVGTTSTKVISGGLDTLETIGKKTMEVLQDGDPGLAKKRAMLGLGNGDKPVLSQVLREAKAKADEEDKLREEKREAKEVHYENLFDDFEGLVHLEALEMLSKQVNMRIEERLRNVVPAKRQDMKETMQQVAELCEMPEEEDEEDEPDADLSKSEAFHERLQNATQDLGLKLQFQALVKQYTEILDYMSSDTDLTVKSIYKRAVSSLAQSTALSVEQYHKAAEMLLVKTRRSTADEADALTQMTVVLTKHISELATLFTEKLNALPEDDKSQINNYITNIFLEAGNSSTYIQNAFQLALPILQIGAV